MDKITQAHNDLIEALDIADRLRQEGIEVAKDNIAKLSELSASLMQRAEGLLQQGKEPGPDGKQIGGPEAPTART